MFVRNRSERAATVLQSDVSSIRMVCRPLREKESEIGQGERSSSFEHGSHHRRGRERISQKEVRKKIKPKKKKRKKEKSIGTRSTLARPKPSASLPTKGAVDRHRRHHRHPLVRGRPIDHSGTLPVISLAARGFLLSESSCELQEQLRKSRAGNFDNSNITI